MPLPSPEKYNNDDLDLEETSLPVRQIRNLKERRKSSAKKIRQQSIQKQTAEMQRQAEISQQADEHKEAFNFTYLASRYESGWLTESLGYFYENHWINDVIRMIKGGKEASVYLCQANPSSQATWIAAKVYRPRRFRNLKNDTLYREGRPHMDEEGHFVQDHGALHAIQKRTAFGMEMLHTSWIQHEFTTLQILRQAGADVPIPYACGANAILMGYVGDEAMAAPTLNSVNLSQREARLLLQRVLHNIEVALSVKRIHADLSAFNILYWNGGITLIDFPQAIDPELNTNAFRIFERDVVRVCQYFTRQGAPADGKKLAHQMWEKYNYPFEPQIEPVFLD